MKIYVVYRGFPKHVFLDEEKAKQYIDSVNTSPYETDHYRIMEMETADELLLNFKLVTRFWFQYELKDGKNHYFFLNNREVNTLDNDIIDINGEINYKEILYHNSQKPRVRYIRGSFYLEKRESEIDWEKYEVEFRSKCKELMEKIIHKRTNLQWRIEQVNDWLPKEPFVIK